MFARSEALGIFRWAVCLSKKDHLVARVLFLLAQEEEESFIYGSEGEHRTLVVLNDQQYLGYLFWSENRGRLGKREPVLRQLFVRKEFRRQGIGTAMVQTWADRFAFPRASLFGVESPNTHSQSILVRLGYAHIEGENIVGTKCRFVNSV
jgi:GNAT superfamily N-acetyltransferase